MRRRGVRIMRASRPPRARPAHRLLVYAPAAPAPRMPCIFACCLEPCSAMGSSASAKHSARANRYPPWQAEAEMHWSTAANARSERPPAGAARGIAALLLVVWWRRGDITAVKSAEMRGGAARVVLSIAAMREACFNGGWRRGRLAQRTLTLRLSLSPMKKRTLAQTARTHDNRARTQTKNDTRQPAPAPARLHCPLLSRKRGGSLGPGAPPNPLRERIHAAHKRRHTTTHNLQCGLKRPENTLR